MTLELDATAEDIQVWLQEAEEQLQLLDEELVRLERESDDQDLLQAIFRAAHTLKGSSAAIKHTRMAELTHRLENVLDDLRNGHLSVNSELVDVLLEALDALRVLRDEVITLAENPDLDVTAVTARLQAAQAAGSTPPAAPLSPAPAPTLPDLSGLTLAQLRDLATLQGIDLSSARRKADVVARLTQALEAATAAAPKAPIDFGLNPAELQHARSLGLAGQVVYHLGIDIAAESAMPAARCLQVLNELGALGTVVSTVPTGDQIMAEDVDTRFDVLIASDDQPEALEAAAQSVLEIDGTVVRPYFDTDDDPDDRLVDRAEAVPPAGDRRVIDLGPEARGKSEGEQLKVAAAKLTRLTQTVRIDVARLDALMNLVGELVIDKTRLQQISVDLTSRFSGDAAVAGLDQAALHVGRITDELQEEVMRSRMQPIETVFNKLPRIVRDLARNMDKRVDFVIEGKETELDRSVIEEIGDPLIHIIRNAVDHGIEAPDVRQAQGKPEEGIVTLAARHEENQIVISVADDGGGIDPERLRQKAIETGQLTQEAAERLADDEAVELIFRSGVSTATEITDVSGRGVGMDIVRTNIEKLNGNVSVNSELGRGSVVEIRLPLTLAIVRALLVKLQRHTFAVPLTAVMESLERRADEILTVQGQEVIRVRDDVLPLVRLKDFFDLGNGATHGLGAGLPDLMSTGSDAPSAAASGDGAQATGADREQAGARIPVVAVKVGARRSGFAVDELLGEQEIVIKSLGGFIGEATGIAGATILGDGQVAMIVDVNGVVQTSADRA